MSVPMNQFQFGNQTITTKVFVMAPRQIARRALYVDVTAAMDEQPRSRAVSLKVVAAPAEPIAARRPTASDDLDPYAEVEV
jgi:hypothetical protein